MRLPTTTSGGGGGRGGGGGAKGDKADAGTAAKLLQVVTGPPRSALLREGGEAKASATLRELGAAKSKSDVVNRALSRLMTRAKDAERSGAAQDLCVACGAATWSADTDAADGHGGLAGPAPLCMPVLLVPVRLQKRGAEVRPGG